MRILVVDDNVDSAAIMLEWLKTLGHEVEMTHDGASAIELAATYLPDIMLVDIAMPEMNGWEVARRVKRLDLAPMPKLIAVSAFSQPAHLEQSKLAGFEAHLVKPFTLQRFVDALDRIG